MSDRHTQSLQEELDQFRREKEQIRAIVGQIGGVQASHRDKVINIVFITAIVVLFAGDVLRHLLEIHVPLPPMFSLELGVLLVSIKIIWMIYKQGRVEHFQFWILSSIEFRLNDLAKRMSQLEHRLTDVASAASGDTDPGVACPTRSGACAQPAGGFSAAQSADGVSDAPGRPSPGG